MKKTFHEAIKHRRSYYALSNASPISDEAIQEILYAVSTYTPSAFNSQSTRMVLLLGDAHKKLWDIVKETLRKKTSAETFVNTEKKIDSCFLSGYGTVLFFEDETIIKDLQSRFPLYKDNFPIWSHHTNAMHQFNVWTMLEDAGFGASLQHYNPLIDEEVKATWNLPAHWQLVAQMPFGTPLEESTEKQYLPIEEKVFVINK